MASWWNNVWNTSDRFIRLIILCSTVNTGGVKRAVADVVFIPGVEFLGDYARRFLVRLDAMTSNGEIPKLAPTLLICGHSIYTNAIVWEAAELLDVPSDLALETYLGETDGFLLTDKKITMLSSLSS